MMLIPVDAYAAVVQAFVAAVERNVLPDSILVLFDEVLHSAKRRFFFDGEHKDQIGFGFDPGFIESANRSKHRRNVSSIVANSGRVDFAVSDLSFYGQSRLKNGIEMCIEDHWHGAA